MEEITFFSTMAGKITVIAVITAIAVLFCAFLRKGKIFTVRSLTFSSLAIALAVLLSYIPIIRMPQGGSITLCSMLMIVLIGYWFGALPGIFAGMTYGLLQLILNPYVIHPVQLLFDYVFAFGALGLAGLFYKKPEGLIYGYLIGVMGRFIFTFLSGYIFFKDYTPEGMSPIMYSAGYNIAYIGGEAFLTLMILMIPSFRKAIDYEKRILNTAVGKL